MHCHSAISGVIEEQGDPVLSIDHWSRRCARQRLSRDAVKGSLCAILPLSTDYSDQAKMLKFRKRTEIDKDFYQQNLMGPSAVRILEEFAGYFDLAPGMCVLDLGCGKGLTSIFLAREYDMQVFAADLWTPASENHERFLSFGLGDRIIPIHADSSQELPFALGYFDAVVSVDAYYYFGLDEDYLDRYMAPLLKPGGFIAVATPGLQKEFSGVIPDEMKLLWTEELTVSSTTFTAVAVCGRNRS